MGIGARDEVDQTLIEIYADVQTNNVDETSKLAPEEVWQSMSLMAMNNRNIVQINKPTMKRKSDIYTIEAKKEIKQQEQAKTPFKTTENAFSSANTPSLFGSTTENKTTNSNNLFK